MLKFILGMVFMQLLATIAWVVWDDDDKTVIVSCGAWVWIFRQAGKVVGSIMLWWLRRNYKLYQVFMRVDNNRGMSGWLGNFYMTEKCVAEFARVLDKDEEPQNYSIRLLREGKELKTVPHKWELTKTKEDFQTFYGTHGVAQEYGKKFFE